MTLLPDVGDSFRAELGIAGAKHLAYPARADGRDDFVGANPAAGLYRQGWGSP